MCVKEFIGFSCGHCSVPIIIRCPIAAQSEAYPICSISAERSNITKEYCHPCARVAWNKSVLNNENEHRFLHESGLCDCGLAFTDQEKEDQRLQELEAGYQMQNMKRNAKGFEAAAASVSGTKKHRHKKRDQVAFRKLNNEQLNGPRIGNPHYLSQPGQTLRQPILIPVPKSAEKPLVRLPPKPGSRGFLGYQRDEPPFTHINFYAEAETVDEVGQQVSGICACCGTPPEVEPLETSLADMSLFQAPVDFTSSSIPMQEHLTNMRKTPKAPAQINIMKHTTRKRSQTS